MNDYTVDERDQMDEDYEDMYEDLAPFSEKDLDRFLLSQMDEDCDEDEDEDYEDLPF